MVEPVALQDQHPASRRAFRSRVFHQTSVERNRGTAKRSSGFHFRWNYWGERRRALHIYRVPDRTEYIRNSDLARSTNSVAWMDSPSRSLVPLVLVDNGDTTPRTLSKEVADRLAPGSSQILIALGRVSATRTTGA